MKKGEGVSIYSPKENLDLINYRVSAFIIKNDRNYELTYKFIFNIFDVDQNKFVSISEINETAMLFSQD